MLTNTCTCSYIHTNTCSCSLSHTNTCTLSHTCTNMHMLTHTHTHMLSHTLAERKASHTCLSIFLLSIFLTLKDRSPHQYWIIKLFPRRGRERKKEKATDERFFFLKHPVSAIKTLLNSFLWHSDSNCTEGLDFVKTALEGLLRISCGGDSCAPHRTCRSFLCCPLILRSLSLVFFFDSMEPWEKKHQVPWNTCTPYSPPPRLYFLLWPTESVTQADSVMMSLPLSNKKGAWHPSDLISSCQPGDDTVSGHTSQKQCHTRQSYEFPSLLTKSGEF